MTARSFKTALALTTTAVFHKGITVLGYGSPDNHPIGPDDNTLPEEEGEEMEVNDMPVVAMPSFNSPVNHIIDSDNKLSEEKGDTLYKQETEVHEMPVVAMPSFNSPVNHIIDSDNKLPEKERHTFQKHEEIEVREMPIVVAPIVNSPVIHEIQDEDPVTHEIQDEAPVTEEIPIEVIFVNQLPDTVSSRRNRF